MNRKATIAILSTIIITAAGLAVAMALYTNSSRNNSNDQPQTQTTTSNPPKPVEQQKQPSSVTTPSPGTYTAYTDEAVQKTTGTKILFFHAPWCPQCRALDKSIKESDIPDNVTIFKVDYDSNQTLRQKYGVTIQTTLVKIDDAGNLVTKYVAYDEPNFQAVKEHLL